MKCKVKGCSGEIQLIYRNGRPINNSQRFCEGHTNAQGHCTLEILRRELIGHAKHNYEQPIRVRSIAQLNEMLPNDMTCPVTGELFDLQDWMGENYPYPEPINPSKPMSKDNIRWVSIKGREEAFGQQL